MSDDYQSHGTGLDSPCSSAEAIDYSGGDVTLNKTTRALYVGSTGNLVCTMANGGTATFNTIPAGTVLPIRITGVTASGTTADDMVGLS